MLLHDRKRIAKIMYKEKYSKRIELKVTDNMYNYFNHYSKKHNISIQDTLRMILDRMVIYDDLQLNIEKFGRSFD